MGNDQSTHSVSWDCQSVGLSPLSNLKVVDDHDQPAILPALEGAAAATVGASLYLFGGGNEENQSNQLIRVHSPSGAPDSWQCTFLNPSTPQIPSPRTGAALAHLVASDGRPKLLLFGGFSQQSASGWLDDTYLFDVNDRTWTPIFASSRPSPRDKVAVAALDANRVLVFGGWGPQNEDDGEQKEQKAVRDDAGHQGEDDDDDDEGGVDEEDDEEDDEDRGPCAVFTWFSDLWCFDLRTLDWQLIETNGELPEKRAAASLSLIGTAADPLLLLFGGREPEGRTNSLFGLDSKTWTWRRLTPLGPLPTARSFHSAIGLSESRIMVFGGRDNQADSQDLNDVHVYDAETNSWAQPALSEHAGATPLPARGFAAASPTPCGDSILIYGGSTGSTFYNDILILDAQPFIKAPAMTVKELIDNDPPPLAWS